MELKVTKEKISSAEVVFTDLNEQSVELDYILPDYYPEIFKVLKCIAVPHITSFDVTGDKLSYEMSVSIRILYCAEDNDAVQIIEQKLNYFKKIDLGRMCVNPSVSIIPQISFMNCRAVNQRRIDVRGAVSTSINVTDIVANEMISEADGGGVQLKKVSLTYPSNHIRKQKKISISDEFDLGMSKPSVLNIIRSDAVITSCDNKIISNKLIVKGEICINMLYTYCKENKSGIEAMQFTLPFSQVIDMEGIDDRFNCILDTEVISCDVYPRSDGDGNSKNIECKADILISCSAYRTSTADLAVDEYSTLYKTEDKKANFIIEMPPQQINSACVIKNTLTSAEGEIECVYDAWCNIKTFNIQNDTESKQFIITGVAEYYVIGKNTEGSPIVYEKEDNFTANIPAENMCDNSRIDIKLVPISCSYNLASDSSIEIKAELKLSGNIVNVMNICGITEIIVSEDELLDKNQNYALKIYYTNGDEDLWEIAKKYGTSVSAIIEENEIEDDTIIGSGMLLIPIV